MKELSKEAIEKMDSASRAQYYRIQKDNLQEQERQKQFKANLDFEGRLLELEVAREVQIGLNSQFKEAIAKLKRPTPAPFKWPWQ